MRDLLRHHYVVCVLLILAFSFVTRVWNLHTPENYVFDEVYHAVTVKLIARDDARAYEWWNAAPEPNTAVDWLHPPLAKLTQAAAVRIAGENAFGWRISSVLFGVGLILVTILLTEKMTKSKIVALTAGTIASLDGLLLVQSRIAMNDIHVSFFILLTVLFYILYRQKKSVLYLVVAAVSAGLAVASKWSGVFIVGWLMTIEGSILLLETTSLKTALRNSLKFLGFALMLTGITTLIYFGSYSQMFLQGKSFDHFVNLHKQIWRYQTTLDATHPYQSRPLEWFFDTKPVWYYVNYVDQAARADIYAFGNPLLQWTGVIAVVFFLTYLAASVWNTALSRKAIKTKLLTITTSPELLLLSAYAFVWTPWFFSPRIMFYYHYTPAVPFLSILIAIFLWKLWATKVIFARIVVIILTVLISLTFFVWYPHWTGIPMPYFMKDSVYFVFEGWK